MLHSDSVRFPSRPFACTRGVRFDLLYSEAVRVDIEDETPSDEEGCGARGCCWNGEVCMPSFEDRPPGMSGAMPGLKQFAPPVAGSSAVDHVRVSSPARGGRLPGQEPETPAPTPTLAPPAITRQFAALPRTTRQLTATLPDISEPGPQRTPLVIKGEMKKVALMPPALPPAMQQKRRSIVSLVGMGLLLLIVVLTFLMVTPLGHDIGLGFSSLPIGGSLFSSRDNSPGDLVVQATATAVYHRRNDGYDPSSSRGQALARGNISLNWPVGQCTYWANLRYHTLTGYWIPWNGNANQWVAGARAAGWHVSTSPHVPSIVVLMPGTQGAGGYGHVAIVESASGNTVHTSNMNWYSNGGGFNIYSTADFTAGPGAYFVWHS